MGQRAIPSRISRHSYHPGEQTVKSKKLDYRVLQYSDKGRLPAVKQQIVDMTLNGSGVRDIVRVLGVSSATVIDVLKKKSPRSHRSTTVS